MDSVILEHLNYFNGSGKKFLSISTVDSLNLFLEDNLLIFDADNYYSNINKNVTIDGKLEGLSVVPQQDGGRATGEYFNDRKVGTWTIFYSSGIKQSEMTYGESEDDAFYRDWYPSGKPRSEGRYKKGIHRGGWLFWRENDPNPRLIDYF